MMLITDKLTGDVYYAPDIVNVDTDPITAPIEELELVVDADLPV